MWGTSPIPSKEQVLDSLYSQCQNRSARTVEVVEAMVRELKLTLTPDEKEKLVEIIRPYKQSGKHLEPTLNAVYEVIEFMNTMRIDNG